MRTVRQVLQELSPEAVRILACVCIEGECSQTQVAGITGMAVNTVKKALRELGYHGLIAIDHGGGRRPHKKIRANQPTLLADILEV